MSRRRQQYEIGIERLCEVYASFLQNEVLPSNKELQTELDAILELKYLDVSIIPLNKDLGSYSEFAFIISEDYTRSDHVLPKRVRLYVFPKELANEREIYQTLARLDDE